MRTVDEEALYARRLAHWGQTPATRIPDPATAAQFVARVGVATLYPASSELPNLFHAYMGDPDAATDSGHDSPSGEVYGWRWALGRAEAAFYTAIVRGRPTWVHWDLLPAVLRLCADERMPDEIYDTGDISGDAYRVARALEEAGGVLRTGELRARAGFPTGKKRRTAYLKAVHELDTRLLLAKVFSEDDLDMRHALVRERYPRHVAAAEAMTREGALDLLLAAYLPHAVYAVPAALAKALKLPEAELHAGLERLAAGGAATAVTLAGHKGDCYAWRPR